MKYLSIVLLAVVMLSGIGRAEAGGVGFGVIIGEPTGLSAKFWLGGDAAVDGYLYVAVGNGSDRFFGRRVHGYREAKQSAGLLSVNRGPTLRHVGHATVIDYQLDAPARVAAEVYDLTGRLVNKLFTGQQQTGKYELTWNHTAVNGNRVSPGVYFVALERGSERTRLKAVVW